jgi:hypothetical protein
MILVASQGHGVAMQSKKNGQFWIALNSFTSEQ